MREKEEGEIKRCERDRGARSTEELKREGIEQERQKGETERGARASQRGERATEE